MGPKKNVRPATRSQESSSLIEEEVNPSGPARVTHSPIPVSNPYAPLSEPESNQASAIAGTSHPAAYSPAIGISSGNSAFNSLRAEAASTIPIGDPIVPESTRAMGHLWPPLPGSRTSASDDLFRPLSSFTSYGHSSRPVIPAATSTGNPDLSNLERLITTAIGKIDSVSVDQLAMSRSLHALQNNSAVADESLSELRNTFNIWRGDYVRDIADIYNEISQSRTRPPTQGQIPLQTSTTHSSAFTTSASSVRNPLITHTAVQNNMQIPPIITSTGQNTSTLSNSFAAAAFRPITNSATHRPGPITHSFVQPPPPPPQNSIHLHQPLGNQHYANDTLNRIIIPEYNNLPKLHLKTSDVSIPHYSGSMEKKTPFEFLLELEKYMSISGYTVHQMLEYVIPIALTEEAYEWYRFEKPFTSWDQFASKFRNEFQAVGYYEALRRELEMRTQGPSEPLSTFIRIILNYYHRLGERVHEHDIVTRILRQMHPRFRSVLQSKVIRNLRELKEAAQEAQEVLKAYLTYQPPPTTSILEPSLAWKGSIPNTSNNPNAECIAELASVDPYSYFHQNKSKHVSFNDNRPRSPNLPNMRFINTPIVGSPAQQQRPNSPNGRTSPFSGCYDCGSKDHIRRNCPRASAKPAENSRPPSPKPKGQ